MTINGKSLKTSVEVSPERRQLFKNYYRALDYVRTKLDVSHLEFCSRTFQIYLLPDYDVIGNIPKGSTEFKWDLEVCKKAKLPENPNEDIAF